MATVAVIQSTLINYSMVRRSTLTAWHSVLTAAAPLTLWIENDVVIAATGRKHWHRFGCL